MAASLDWVILHFDRALRTLAGVSASVRPIPGADLPDCVLTDAERQHVGALMRVNHVGEVCAQALYQGQAISSRNDQVRVALEQAADEEVEHLAWTMQRIKETGGRTSLLNPLWFGGSLGLGVLAGLAGNRWNLGFLAETERQVEAHLDSHIDRLPAQDKRSRAILEQMRSDEHNHAQTARNLGAAMLPSPVRLAMTAASRLMTRTAYFI